MAWGKIGQCLVKVFTTSGDDGLKIKNNLDVYSLSRLMGHENIKITQRYLQGMQDKDIVSRSISSSPLMNL